MYQIDFSHPIHVHFIGIGGISMSGLAAVLVRRGFRVSGSDRAESNLTKWLEKIGAAVYYGQRASNIESDTDLVVYTAAIHPDNPEYQAAAARKLPMLTRAELLGQLMANYPLPIAVAGTHGKTTTTSMISHILLAADTDPTISVGGILPVLGGNIRVGGGDIFLTEACEYTNSFLDFLPKIGIILNVEHDHPDFFPTLQDVRDSFHRFAKLLPQDGTLIISGAIPNVQELTEDLSCRVLLYGEHSADGYHAEHITYDKAACASFDLLCGTRFLGHYTLKVPGEHNVENALAALVLSEVLGIAPETVQKGLLEFRGAERRFQHLGDIGGVTVIDDYAHHPTEVAATLKTAQLVEHNHIWCVFQPHTFTRTKNLMDDFAKALSLADRVVLADIYAARETDNLGISSDTLREKVASLGTEAYYFPSFDEIETFLLEKCVPGDLLITMGAGDIVKLAKRLLGE